MQQWYQCPKCGKDILYGTNPCPYCKCSLAWSQQGPILYIPPPGAPQQQPAQAPQYQQRETKPQPKVKKGTYEGPPMQEAIKYAQARGAQIAAKYGLTPTSANRLAQIVSDGIKNKRGIPGLARDIRKEFPDISKSQSELIAQTETASALSKASYDRMKDMGVDGKQWYLGSGGKEGNCAKCIANAAVGIIPIDQPFPSGHMDTPAHDG